MAELSKQVTVEAPRERVWEVLCDFGAVSKWAPTITDSRSLTEANEGVGAERTCEHAKMGTLEERIAEWEEGARYAYTTSGLPMPMISVRSDLSADSAGGATRVDLRLGFETKFGPLGAMMEATMMEATMDREMTLTLAGLKYHLETGNLVTIELEDLPVSAVS